VAYLLDTNILARLANAADSLHSVADQAVVKLHRRNEILHITAQNMVEFRNIATRPISQNGLGLSAVEAKAKAASFESMFPLLPETPDIYPAWTSLVDALAVVGKQCGAPLALQVHDARLLAVCHVHGVTHLLTFNVSDFSRLAGFGPGGVIVDPAGV